MKTTQRTISLVIALITLITLVAFPLGGIVSHAANLVNKKVVSVVYDDSGSMDGPKWAYANYAMQTFVAMLNEIDDVYITYMSNENNPVKVNTSDLPGAVNSIRNHSDSNDTPYGAVRTAMNQLSKVSDSDPNTQYWLVIFTDGEFLDSSNDEVSRDLDSFRSQKMANGSNPQIMFMTIGDTNGEYTPDPGDKSITVVRAEEGKDVSDSLFNIASRVTGRARVDNSDITLSSDGKSISLPSKVPLFSISILIQNKRVSVGSVQYSDGGSNYSDVSFHSIPVSMPPSSISGAAGINEMYGNVTLAKEAQGNIPAGDYKITFSDAISLDDIVVMLEPALELKIKLFIDGTEVTDLDNITVGADGVSAEAALYEYGTDNIIDESLLPGSVSAQMIFSVGGNTVDSVSALKLENIAVGSGKNSVRAIADISGYFNLETFIEFTPVDVPNVDHIEAVLYYDGSPRVHHNDGTVDADNVVYITDLKNNRTGIRFIIYANGAPIDKTAASVLEQRFKSGLDVGFCNYEVEIQNDGSFLVYPTKKPFYILEPLYVLFNHGDQKVAVTLDGMSAEGTLDFAYFRNFPEIIPGLLCLFLIFYFIFWLLFKKHFPRCTLVCSTGRMDDDGSVEYNENGQRVDLNWFGCFDNNNILLFIPKLILLLLPFPSRKRLGGYTITGQWNIFTRNETMQVRNVRDKAVDAYNPDPLEISDERTAELDDMLFIRDGNAYTRFEIEE